jgi:hypothetical protein
VMRFFAPQQDPADPPPTPSAQPPPAAAERSSPEPPAPAPEPSTPAPAEPNEGADRLVAALDSLGQAHHRPFSRA